MNDEVSVTFSVAGAGGNEPIVFKPARWKSALFFLLSVGAFALCLWMRNDNEIKMSLLQDGAVWVALAATPVAAVIYLIQLFAPKPAIEVSAWGIKDFRQKIEAPWEQIRGVGEWEQQAGRAKVKWIYLDVVDPKAVKKKTNAMLDSANAALGAPPVLINANGLPGARRAVKDAIRSFRPNLPIQ